MPRREREFSNSSIKSTHSLLEMSYQGAQGEPMTAEGNGKAKKSSKLGSFMSRKKSKKEPEAPPHAPVPPPPPPPQIPQNVKAEADDNKSTSSEELTEEERKKAEAIAKTTFISPMERKRRQQQRRKEMEAKAAAEAAAGAGGDAGTPAQEEKEEETKSHASVLQEEPVERRKSQSSEVTEHISDTPPPVQAVQQQQPQDASAAVPSTDNGNDEELTEIPEESAKQKAKRAAIQKIMSDKSLSPQDRQLAIQEVIAGNFETPTDSAPAAVAEVAPALSTGGGEDGGVDDEHMTEIPEESKKQKAKRFAIQAVMRDASLTPQERQLKMQQIIKGDFHVEGLTSGEEESEWETDSDESEAESGEGDSSSSGEYETDSEEEDEDEDDEEDSEEEDEDEEEVEESSSGEEESTDDDDGEDEDESWLSSESESESEVDVGAQVVTPIAAVEPCRTPSPTIAPEPITPPHNRVIPIAPTQMDDSDEEVSLVSSAVATQELAAAVEPPRLQETREMSGEEIKTELRSSGQEMVERLAETGQESEISAEEAIAAAGAAQAISREQLRSVESELDAALNEQDELEKQQQEREVEFQRAVAAQQAEEAERKRRLDEERAAALSKQKIEEERRAIEAERQAREKIEEERRALEAERLAREEKIEEERRALEAERLARERIEEERRALEAERQASEKIEEECRALEAERRASEKIEEERRRAFEAERLAREEKIEEERRALEDERRRMAEEAALRERKAKEEMERQLLEQERSHTLARQQLEEERRQAEQEQLQRQLREETARLQEERRRLQEENRAAEEQFRQRQLLESQRLQEERERSQRLLLQDRQADEQLRIKAQLEMDREREMLRVQELHALAGPSSLGMADSSTAMASSRPGNLSAMSVKEIKSELNSLGINTSQFVEKKEMVKALAETRRVSKQRDDVSGPGTSIVSFRPGISGPAHVPPQRSSRYDGVDDDELNWRLDSYVSLSDYTIVVTRALPGPYAPDFTTGDPSMFEFVVEQGSSTPKADVYYVHKAMIAVGSRRAELLGRMIREAESARGFGAHSSENATEHNTIMLESAADAFPAVLDFMYYPDRELDMSVENAVPLVYLGKRYKIRALLELAEDFVESNLESTTAMYFLLDSYLYQLESILTRAIDVTAAHLGETVDFDPIYRLPPTLFKRIILSKDLRCDSELLSLIVYSYCGEHHPEETDVEYLRDLTKSRLMPEVDPKVSLMLLKFYCDLIMKDEPGSEIMDVLDGDNLMYRCVTVTAKHWQPEVCEPLMVDSRHDDPNSISKRRFQDPAALHRTLPPTLQNYLLEKCIMAAKNDLDSEKTAVDTFERKKSIEEDSNTAAYEQKMRDMRVELDKAKRSQGSEVADMRAEIEHLQMRAIKLKSELEQKTRVLEEHKRELKCFRRVPGIHNFGKITTTTDPKVIDKTSCTYSANPEHHFPNHRRGNRPPTQMPLMVDEYNNLGKQNGYIYDDGRGELLPVFFYARR